MNNKKYEIFRAIIHLGLSLILVCIISYVKPIIVAPYVFIILLILEITRLKFPKFNHLLLNHKFSIFNKIIRHDEQVTFSSFSAFCLGFLMISWMPLNIIITVVLINGLADPAARIYGTKWGKKKIFKTNNSFIGSSAFFIVAFFISLTFFNPSISFVAATTGTIAEFLPDKKPLWDDAFRIITITGFALWLII